MEKEFDLKDLKAAWQKQVATQRFSQDDIFKMIKRKSITSVKRIFYISLAEMTFTILCILWYLWSSKFRTYHSELIQNIGVGAAYVYEVILLFSMLVNTYFTYTFYLEYRKIKTQFSVKKLMEYIMQFKSKVNRFVYFNLIMLFISLLVFFVAYIYKLNVGVHDQYFSVIIKVYIVMILAILAIFWTYYYILYGTFTRRLKKNLKSLSEIED